MRDFVYETANVGYDEQYPEDEGGGIKCKNHVVCEAILPKWWFDCKGSYLCTNCDMLFGTWASGNTRYTGKGVLDKVENTECPICLETKKGVSYPNCHHTLCIECFKRCFYGDNDGEPLFPYSDDIQEEFIENRKDPMWNIDYPLIAVYEEAWDTWENNRQEKYEMEDHLRKCPICRK